MDNINVRKKYDDVTDPDNPVKRFEKGNSVGPFWVLCGPNGPVEPAREKVCIASITETDLTDNVYTVTGEPAKRIELINDGAGELTVTISDGTNTTSKVLKPDDVYDQNFTAITTLTFSTGAVFRADILR